VRWPRAGEEGEGVNASEPSTRVEREPAIPDKLYYRIGEVEELTDVPAYVLRYWESEFKLLRPKKNPAGQRLYRRRDLDLVVRIKSLLYGERLTLEGAKKRLLAESRGTTQLDLGLRGAAVEDALRRTRERLRALRERLARGRA
jgi:DNA-binding transcriptional MerR regulator